MPGSDASRIKAYQGNPSQQVLVRTYNAPSVRTCPSSYFEITGYTTNQTLFSHANLVLWFRNSVIRTTPVRLTGLRVKNPISKGFPDQRPLTHPLGEGRGLRAAL